MFGQPVKSYGWSVTKHMTGLPPLRNHLWRKSEHPQRSVKKKKLGPWGPELIWQIATKYKMSRQNWPVIYVCVYVKKNVHACVCLHVCLCLHPCVCICICMLVSLQMCVHVFAVVSVHEYICGMPNIDFVSLAYMHVTKSAKCESGTTSVSMCVHLSVCICIVWVLCQI